MKLALLGGGTIARLVLEHQRRGKLPDVEIVALCGRNSTSRSASLAREFSIPHVWGSSALIDARPDVVLEAASHDAVREQLVPLLEAGISVVVLSAGALAADELRDRAERAAVRSGALLGAADAGAMPNGAPAMASSPVPTGFACR